MAPPLQTPTATEEWARHLADLASLKVIRLESGTTANGAPFTAAIGERAQPFFNRWYLRCQSGDAVSIDDAATVFGLALAWQPSVVLLALTGRLSTEATRYVSEVNRTGSTRFVVLDGDDLRTIGSDPSHFRTVLEHKSRPADAR